MIKNKIVLSIALLISCFTLKTKHFFVELEHIALKLVDGQTPGMNADAIVDCLQVRNAINKTLRGQPNPATKTFIKNYKLWGQEVSLNDLIKIETDLTHKGLGFSDKKWQEFFECLNRMKQEFADFTKPLLGEAELARSTNMHLIKEWCEKTNKHDTLLLSWGSDDEEALLNAATAQEFKTFLLDLRAFLHDLMYNCPKGREQFKEKYLTGTTPEEINNKWTSFDKSFIKT